MQADSGVLHRQRRLLGVPRRSCGSADYPRTRRRLSPTLAKGDVVFADNLRTHKIDGVRQAIDAVGATLRYLPAYSPDLNPIEMAFSKLKAALRKGAKRTVKELWRLIGKLVKSFVPDQCANYFRHAGYKR